MHDLNDTRVAVIGLGYVGLPLAVAFAEKYPVVGYDIHAERVKELNEGNDRTQEVDTEELKAVLRPGLPQVMRDKGFFATTGLTAISDCNVFIITVPTPIDEYKRPVLKPLEEASRAIGRILKKGDVVVYESTVYPGVTDEICTPILEGESGLTVNEDFTVGYSPERINPGDKEHTVTRITKVTSGSTPEAADYIDRLYGSIITAGTHRAASIKVAEAAKVIENAQRDINIAFINELSMIFHRLGIDTREVLAAAGTKWNFLPFQPGLVGGHCIGVDPYYLAQKAQEVGYHPEIILAGRRINDNMGKYVAGEIVKLMIKKGCQIHGSKALVLGVTFKENCPDIRNTRVVDIVKELADFGFAVDVFDPWADPAEVREEYGIDIVPEPDSGPYDTIVLAVGHEFFKALDIEALRAECAVVYDVKGVLDKNAVDARL